MAGALSKWYKTGSILTSSKNVWIFGRGAVILAVMKVAIVTQSIVGPTPCNGIATAYFHLARFLQQEGHDVDIIYARGQYTRDGSPLARSIESYRQLGIRLLPLAGAVVTQYANMPYKHLSYRVYEHLKGSPYDVIHCPDYGGLGYYTLLAREEGLAFADTQFVVGLHSPSLSVHVQCGSVDAAVLELAYREQTSAELADAVVSPSTCTLDYVRQAGWQLPQLTQLIPHLFLQESGESASRASHHSVEPITGFVFFGRLEVRKGLTIFLDALKCFLSGATTSVRVVFLGRDDGFSDQQTAADFIRSELAGYGAQLQLEILTTLDTLPAQDFLLGQRGLLACIPSLQECFGYTVLECLNLQIPFIASNVGGIPEQILPEDRDLCLFPPEPVALAVKMAQAFGRPAVQPRANPLLLQAAPRWRELHATMAERQAGQRVITATPEQPLLYVRVMSTGHNEHLAEALTALSIQTYSNFTVLVEVHVVMSAQGQAQFTALTEKYRPRGWTFVQDQAAVPAAAGAYLLFIPDTCRPCPHALATLAHAARHANADVIICSTERYAETAGQRQSLDIWLPGGSSVLPGLLHDDWSGAPIMVQRQVYEELAAGRVDEAFCARVVLRGRRLWVLPEILFKEYVDQKAAAASPVAYFSQLQHLEPYKQALPPVLRGIPQLVLSLQDEAVARHELHRLRAEYRRPAYRFLRWTLEVLALAPPIERLARLMLGSIFRLDALRKMLRHPSWRNRS